jgi:hypothetical protein
VIQVVDNFLTSEDFRAIEESMRPGSGFPWYYYDSVIGTGEPHESHYQFVHVFYANKTWSSSYANILAPCVEQLGAVSLLRIKANLLLKTDKQEEHGFHIDCGNVKTPWKTAIYYVNTNDGYTLFEDGTKVQSEANRLVVFDGSLMHTGASCTDEKTRVVVNFNFFV